MRKIRPFLWLVVGSIVLSGCSLIPASTKPVAIKKVPFGLLGRTIPGTNNGRVRFTGQPIYIVDAAGHLSSLSRIVTAPAGLTSVLDQLIIGPTKIEKYAGYASDLPSKLLILQATVKGKIGYIDLSKSLTALAGEKELLAIGQLVFTAFYAGATNGIEISVAGVPQRSLLPDHTSLTLVTVKDCESLLEP
jgi:hypothetical protein